MTMTVAVYILSISLQVAGALLLLIHSLSAKKEAVLKRFTASKLITHNGTTNELSFDKKAYKNEYKVAYFSKCAFFFIALGYFGSIFGTNDNMCKCTIAIITLGLTILIMLATTLIISLITKYSKKCNEEIKIDDLNKIGKVPDIGTISTEDIKNL